MFQLVSKPADFAPKRKVVNFDQTRVLRPGPKLRPVYDVAGSLLDDLGRDPNLRRVRDSDVGCASRVFGNLRRQNRSQGFVQIFPVGRDSRENRKDKGNASLRRPQDQLVKLNRQQSRLIERVE
jgi:hypothetical protein